LRLKPVNFRIIKNGLGRAIQRTRLSSCTLTFFKQISPAVVKEVEENMVRVRPKFERTKYDGTKELRSSWASRNLADRSIVTGHVDAYRLINPISSSFVHETMYGMIRYFDAKKDINRIGIPPTLEESNRALSGAHHGMARVVKTLSDTFSVAAEPTAEQLEKDWYYAWPQATQTIS
jgi:hypothetical protein